MELHPGRTGPAGGGDARSREGGRQQDGPAVEANSAGRKPVKYRIYGSDEKGFSVSDEPYRRNVGQSRDVPVQAPANFVAETSNTSWSSSAPGWGCPTPTRHSIGWWPSMTGGSGAGLPTMLPRSVRSSHSKPPDAARVGKEFRYQVAVIRSLGDLRCASWRARRWRASGTSRSPGSSWFRARTGSAWTRQLACSRRAGRRREPDVVVKVTLERSVRRLDEGR